MARLQLHKPENGVVAGYVSIPQAVWPGCNNGNKYYNTINPAVQFQYRKRYGPVATVSSGTRSGTGLKIRLGKPPQIFAIFSHFFLPRKFQRYVTSVFVSVIMRV